MIKLKHVSKTYKSKKGTNTKAIDDVTLTLDHKGMTFILGKSGSGKSTLLNVLGGLDKYDSGDITILGKSTKKFKKKDYDSYRNTYIGFVFQEFNILEDYNVYDNIILALELQQKKVEQERVEELLKKLELNDLRTRKVNELSGGQKQRVAIARALVKDPKIILADEPTGNLDSTTSRQVMDLLKEISKEKLVAVVSHDVESANTYADRIIEISDGKIVRDEKRIEEVEHEKNNDQYQLIKSKLPWKKSFKLGIGSLRHKKIKLFFTILLTVFALLFLSISDTLSSYDVEKAHSKLLKEENIKYVEIQKYQIYKEEWIGRDQLILSEDDENKIRKEVNEVIPVYYVNKDYSPYGLTDLLQISEVDNYDFPYYSAITTAQAEVVEFENIKDILDETIIGKEPSNYNEIMISNYVADIMMENGIQIYDNSDKILASKTYFPKSYEEIVNSNHEFYFGTKQRVKIVGIINYNLKPYKDLRDKKKISARKMNILSSEISRNVRYVYNKIYVKKGFIKHLQTEDISLLNQNNNYFLESKEILLQKDGYYILPNILNKEVEYYDGKQWKKVSHLNKNEMLLNVTQLKNFQIENYQKQLDEYLKQYPEEDDENLKKEFFEHYFNGTDIIGKLVNLNVYEGRSYDPDSKPNTSYQNIKVIGVIPYEEAKSPDNYFSNELVDKYRVNPTELKGLLVKDKNHDGFKELLNKFPHDNMITAVSPFTDNLLALVSTIGVFKKIAFYTSLVFFIFAIFLISNFIFTSIHYRKKEIGILRALGAKTFDVIKIFLWEGFVLSILSGTIASILLVVITNTLNDFIISRTGIILTPFIIGIRQFILIYFVVLIVVLISSILPIRKTSKMKPIDAILNK